MLALKVCASSVFLTSLVVGTSCPDGSDSCAASPTNGSVLLQKGAMSTVKQHTTSETATTRQAPLSFTPNNGLYHELALLAGDAGQQWVEISQKGRSDLQGWDWGEVKVIEVHDPHTPQEVKDAGDMWKDIVKVYSKIDGTNTICAIAFSAADDLNDFMQIYQGHLNPAQYCGHTEINKAYVDGFDAIFNDPAKKETWKTMMDFLKNTCHETWSVGHGSGAGFASVFAFCMNKATHSEKANFPGLDGTKQVKLFQISASAPSKNDPLYNGAPGNCFDGLRIQSYVPMIPLSNEAYIDIAKWFKLLFSKFTPAALSAFKITPAHLGMLDQAISAMEQQHLNGQQSSFDSTKQGILALIEPSLDFVAPIAKKFKFPPSAGMGFLEQNYDELERGISDLFQKYPTMLAIPYDPVPYFSYHAHWKHALVSTQSVPLKDFSEYSQGDTQVCTHGNDVVSEYPMVDKVQTIFGSVLGDMPNNDICCLYPNWADCSLLFSDPQPGPNGDMQGYGVHCNLDSPSKNLARQGSRLFAGDISNLQGVSSDTTYTYDKGSASLLVTPAGIKSEVHITGTKGFAGNTFKAHLHALPCDQNGGKHYQDPKLDPANYDDQVNDVDENHPETTCVGGICTGSAINTWVPTDKHLSEGLSIVIHDTPRGGAKFFCADLRPVS